MGEGFTGTDHRLQQGPHRRPVRRAHRAGSAGAMGRDSENRSAALVIVPPTGRRPFRGAFAPVAAVLSSHEGCRSGVCGSRIACLGPGREGREITSGRRDARGLTFSVVIPARAMQPGGSTRGKQNWRIAFCGYGMTLAPRHRVHLVCVASLVHLRCAHRLG
jgi:hypothetical protein